MGASISLENQMKHDVRMMDRHERVVARDITRMTREKKTLGFKIKTHLKNGDMDMVDALATEFMVYNINVKKMSKLKCHLSNVKQKIQLMGSVHTINGALLTLTNTMEKINERMGLSSLSGIIRDYERQLDKTETNVEIFDDTLGADIDEDERRDILDSVLAEIGVEVYTSLPRGPVRDGEIDVEKILESRLQSLLI
jgi:charged multivesicular body protein 2A